MVRMGVCGCAVLMLLTPGYLRYVTPDGEKPQWLGIELDEANGRHDGVMNGKR